MKRSVCSQIYLGYLVIILALSNLTLLPRLSNAEVLQYSVGDEIYLVDQYSEEAIAYTGSHQYHRPHKDEPSLESQRQQQQRHQQIDHLQQQQNQQHYHPQSQQQHPLLHQHETIHQQQQYHHNNPSHPQYKTDHTNPQNQHVSDQHIQQQQQHTQQHQTLQSPHHLQNPQQHHQQQQQLNQQRFNEQQQHHLNPQQQQQHHHTQAGAIQQVSLINTAGAAYRYSHSHVGWKHESTPDGEVNALFISKYESFPVIDQEHQLAEFRYISEQQHYIRHTAEHLLYSEQINTNDDHDYDGIVTNPAGSCDPRPSMLIQLNVQQQYCKTTNPATAENHLNTPHGSSTNVPSLSQITNKPSHNSNIVSFPLVQQHPYESSLMAAIRHYWREISGLCLASAIFLNWLFVVVKRKFFDSSASNRTLSTVESMQQPVSRSISKDTNSSSAQDSAFEETVSPISLEDIDSSKNSSDHPDKSSESVRLLPTSPVFHRQRSSTLKAEPIPISTSPSSQKNSLSISLSNSLNSSEYNSRYSSDFDSIQRLGRGGFGIVFEAKNKIDDCHYAVKRICLPLEKEARERVMREVKALAKLDHVGIVRYYNAWLETPPDEWLKQHDAQLGIVHSKDGLSFASTDGIYERNESERITKGSRESGDNSSSLFGSSPFKRRSNGYRKYLKNNSSSPSLDIVFEGSGSIRLESENNTEKTSSINGDLDDDDVGYKNAILMDNGDNPSDSEDSDFIQFRSRVSKRSNCGIKDDNDDEDDLDFSTPSHWTEPFSSSESNNDSGSGENKLEEVSNKNDHVVNSVNMIRKKALAYQKGLRQLNNVPSAENLHAEKVYLYIQMQLCRKDTLKDWLKTNCENRDKATIFDLFYQIVDAVEYVHSQDLIHRDLKPSNIFFSLDGTLKIGDFGLCRAKTAASAIGSSLDLQEYVAESDVERCFEAVHTEQVGTQLYMSPEQLNGLSYNQKVDIFAMGLILLELLIPFKTQMQRVNVLFKARNNLYSDDFRNDHPNEHELVKALLSRSPQKRPTATEIKQHELLASAQLSEPVIERIYNTRRRTISSNSSTE